MPLIPTPEKVATPATALIVVVPKIVASPSPPLTAMVTGAVLLVTVLPEESIMLTIGWVVNGEPLAAPATLLGSEISDAVPGCSKMVWLVVITPEV